MRASSRGRIEADLIYGWVVHRADHSAVLANLAPSLRDLDWSCILHQADRHRVAPLLYHTLTTTPLKDVMPPSLWQQLAMAYRTTLARNLLLSHEWRRLGSAFGAEGIPVIPIKGITLIDTLYANPGLRPMEDIDLLVLPKDLPHATKVMASMGYRPVAYPWSMAERHRQRFGHHVVYERSNGPLGPVVIELHWQLVSAIPRELPMGPIWARSRRARRDSQDPLTLSPEDTLLSVCVHPRNHPWQLPLIHLVDIARLVRRDVTTLDWSYFCSTVTQHGFAAQSYYILSLAQSLLHAPVPATVLEQLRPSSLRQRLVAHACDPLTFLERKLPVRRHPMPQDFPTLWAIFDHWQDLGYFVLVNWAKGMAASFPPRSQRPTAASTPTPTSPTR